jgi:hypothetical protein
MRIKLFIICTSTFLIGFLTPIQGQTIGEIAARFIDFSFVSDTFNLRAKIFIPTNCVPGEKYPLVLAMHGVDIKGTDNMLQVMLEMSTTWGTDAFQAKHPCFIFSPQCPNTQGSWTDPPVYKSINILLDSIIHKYPVDTNRMYVTGISLGGYGTWNFLLANPGKWAAGLPVCGAPFDVRPKLPAIENIPVWNNHGDADEIVNVNNSRSIFDEFIRLGRIPMFTHKYYREPFYLTDSLLNYNIENFIDLIYTEIPNGKHCEQSYTYGNPLVKKWLFMQRKPIPSSILVDRKDVLQTVSGDIEFTFKTLEMADSIVVLFGHRYSGEWRRLEKINAKTGKYIFHSTMVEDCPYGKLKFIALDSLGLVIGKDFSDELFINNPGNALPYIEFINDRFKRFDFIAEQNYDMKILQVDPDNSKLDIDFWISINNGGSFEKYASYTVDSGIIVQTFNLTELPVTDSMVIKVDVRDTDTTISIQTYCFKNLHVPVNHFEEYRISDVFCYPNPAGSDLFVKAPVVIIPWKIDIYSISGVLTKSQVMLNEQITIDINDLSAGFYLIKIWNSNQNYIFRIIKQ